MRLMAPRQAEEVKSLLIYEDDTAGGLMNSRLFAVHEMEPAGRVVEDLRRTAPPEDEIYYLYVVDSGGRLRGVLSLRDLVVAQPDTLIVDCMRQDAAFVRLDDSREEVARKLIRYNLLAIPVVDEDSHLKGMVTVDDVIDLVTPREWRNQPRRMTG